LEALLELHHNFGITIVITVSGHICRLKCRVHEWSMN